uniref:Uncharacterized protein n=1 Tax=Panstrongylus lignarius TaxID=156445 RepID=A0A224Y0I4_9HEMI
MDSSFSAISAVSVVIRFVVLTSSLAAAFISTPSLVISAVTFLSLVVVFSNFCRTSFILPPVAASILDFTIFTSSSTSPEFFAAISNSSFSLFNFCVSSSTTSGSTAAAATTDSWPFIC